MATRRTEGRFPIITQMVPFQVRCQCPIPNKEGLFTSKEEILNFERIMESYTYICWSAHRWCPSKSDANARYRKRGGGVILREESWNFGRELEYYTYTCRSASRWYPFKSDANARYPIKDGGLIRRRKVWISEGKWGIIIHICADQHTHGTLSSQMPMLDTQ